MAIHQVTRVGVDARMYGLEHAGIGRYVMNLVDRVVVSSLPVHWVVFIHPKYVHSLPTKPNLTIVPTSIRHYSILEQTAFLFMLLRANLDLLHVPHFNVPLLYKRPFVTTIHDILWHKVRGGSVTTLSPLVYYLKYLGYRQSVRHAVKDAAAVLVPSGYVKKDLLATFPAINQNKIHITYEGAANHSLLDKKSKTTPGGQDPFFIYIGSAYPHKNVAIIFEALNHLINSGQNNVKLVVVSSRSVFLDKLKQEAAKLKIEDKVAFAGHQPDAVVLTLLHQAVALIHPSKSEGFGLTGIEAMQAGTPVIASDAAALPEIYADAALFFNPQDSRALASRMQELLSDSSLRNNMISKGIIRAADFSWDKMAAETMGVYESLLSLRPGQ